MPIYTKAFDISWVGGWRGKNKVEGSLVMKN